MLKKQLNTYYQTWIDKSINDIKSSVLVYMCDNKILGFVSVVREEKHYSIDLTAVDESARGKVVGEKIFHAVEAKIGVSQILMVPT